MSGAVVSALFGLALLVVGGWGLVHHESLVSGSLIERRRDREVRSLRRGARSCLVMGLLFAMLAIVQVVSATGAG